MGKVIDLPNGLDRSWNLMKPLMLETLLQAGLTKEVADKITEEMEPYHRLCYAPLNVEWSVPNSLGLTHSQSDGIQAALIKSSEALRDEITLQRNEIQARFLALLVEKYTGGKPNGAA